jgi:8-oxo-dGTP pyrophosphatase MutT (NUDIX family)
MELNKEKENQPLDTKATRIISAGIIVFRRTKEGIKFLILYHGRDYWNFPKGKLEQAERSWQAAFREVREETGLKSTELKLVGNFKAFEKFFYRRGNDRIFKVVILYLAETKQPNITVSDEHEGYGWFKFSEAKKIMGRYKDSVKILEKAYNFLQKGKVPAAANKQVVEPPKEVK